MGKSIYQQLINGEGDVDHNGETLTAVEMPKWLQQLGVVYAKGLDKEEEEAALTDVLIDHNMISEFYSLAVQQAVVGWRAFTRPTDLPHPELKGEKIKQSIKKLEQECRATALTYVPKPLQRPKTTVNSKAASNAVDILRSMGWTEEEI
ncbi:MAG: hypothetical protein GY833_09740, partial [Aestuariibacter sp.]|nr:hypothetical protein [Aestuariibacter sp.]